MKEEKKRKKIAILRGGEEDYNRSMKSGANVIISLLKYPDLVDVSDVVIDEKGNWFEKGIPSDTHKVFSSSDFYIDLTRQKNKDYHKLSQKLDVRPIFRKDDISALNRINIKRILNQLNIDTPKYAVLRNKDNLENELRNLWSKFQTPILIKESDHYSNKKSLLTYSFIEAFKKIKKILDKGEEALIEEHVDGKYVSVAGIPNYRGEEIYVPTPVELINMDANHRHINGQEICEKCLVDHSYNKKSLIHIPEHLKKDIKGLVNHIHKTLFLNYHTLVDLCLVENKKDKTYKMKVLEVHVDPQLFEDSRFDFILQNAGVDLGRFILDRVEEEESRDLVY